MEYRTTEELYVIVYHLPFQVVTASRPVVMVDSLIAVDGDEVLLGVACQFAVEVGSGDNSLFVLGEATGCLLHDGKHLEHYLVKGFLIDVKSFFLQFVYLVEDGFALVNGRVFDSCL